MQIYSKSLENASSPIKGDKLSFSPINSVFQTDKLSLPLLGIRRAYDKPNAQ